MGTIIKRPDEAERLRGSLHGVVYLADQIRDKLTDPHGHIVKFFTLKSFVEDYWKTEFHAHLAITDLPPWIVKRCNSLCGSHFVDNVHLALNDLNDWMRDSRPYQLALRNEVDEAALVKKVESEGPPDFAQQFHVLREADRILRAIIITEVDGVVQPETEDSLPSAPAIDFFPDEVSAKILRHLFKRYPVLVKQEDISVRESLPTVKDRLEKFKNSGLIDRPQGPKAGCQLTEKGKRLAEMLPAEPTEK